VISEVNLSLSLWNDDDDMHSKADIEARSIYHKTKMKKALRGDANTARWL